MEPLEITLGLLLQVVPEDIKLVVARTDRSPDIDFLLREQPKSELKPNDADLIVSSVFADDLGKWVEANKGSGQALYICVRKG